MFQRGVAVGAEAWFILLGVFFKVRWPTELGPTDSTQFRQSQKRDGRPYRKGQLFQFKLVSDRPFLVGSDIGPGGGGKLLVAVLYKQQGVAPAP